MAKQTISNTELRTGKYIGKDGSRDNAEPDGIRYFSKCYFGIYFTCDISGIRGNRKTAYEKLSLLRNYRQSLLLIAKAYPEYVGQCTTVLKGVLLAEAELQSYNANDIVCDRKQYRDEIKNCISALKQRIRQKYGNVAF